LQQADQTAADPQQESQTSLLLTTDDVNKGSNRSETNRRSGIYVSNSKPVLHLQGTRQPAKDLDMKEEKGVFTRIAVEEQKAALTEPRTGNYTDDESEDDFEEAKTNLMILIKDNTKEAGDNTTYKKYEKIRDSLDEDEDNENEMYLKDALNKILFKKINTIQDILDKRSSSIQKIKEIETFLSSVTDENIIKEVETYVGDIISFKDITSRKKDEWSRMINEVGDELKRLFSIFLPEIIKYIELLKTQKGQDDPKRPQSESTDGSNIQQDPSNPHLLEKQNPLNVSRNSSASLRPIQSEDSELFSQLDKFHINDKNEKKMETAKFLINFYIKYIKIIKNELLTKASTYYYENKYMEKVKQHFDYIIDKAFKILNFDVITNVEKELLVLERYQLDYTSKTFDEMRRYVNVRYGDDTTGYTLKTNALTTIALLEKNLNSFNFKCHDLLIVLFRNNKTDKIWKGGGQPRKSQRKEHINNTGAMKKKLTTKDPNANEPTAKKPTKTPKTKKPTKTPKQKEPNAKDPKQKEPTKTPKIKEPKVKKLTKTPKQKEPKAKDPKANEPITKTPKIKEPNAKKPTKTPKAKEPKPTKK
jgi:hypothetical protein